MNKNSIKKIVSIIIFISIFFSPINTNAQVIIETDSLMPSNEPYFDYPTTDPTLLTTSAGMGAGVSAGGVVGGCAAKLVTGIITQKLGGMVSGALDKVTGAIGGALGSIPGVGGVVGGLLGGGTVPVSDQQVITNTGAIVSKETSLDSVAYCLVNSTIEAIINGTIDWVNGGFNGNPVFVDDPAKFFGDIADYELGQILDELSGGLLCSTFDIEVRLAIISSHTKRKGYGDACTLSDIIENVEGFLDGNFNEGGWDGWFELTQKTQNNPRGAFFLAQQEFNSRQYNKTAVANFELNINKGFLSIKDEETGETTTPGLLIQEKLSQRLGIPENRLTFADEFDELMDALVNQFIKMALGEML